MEPAIIIAEMIDKNFFIFFNLCLGLKRDQHGMDALTIEECSSLN
jgi:hypothetical protein